MLSVLNVLGMSPLFPGFVLIQYQSNFGFLTSFKYVLLMTISVSSSLVLCDIFFVIFALFLTLFVGNINVFFSN